MEKISNRNIQKLSKNTKNNNIENVLINWIVDGNENDKWRSVRQTNEFRESRPFGDIAFASKEGGDIISESEKEGLKSEEEEKIGGEYI